MPSTLTLVREYLSARTEISPSYRKDLTGYLARAVLFLPESPSQITRRDAAAFLDRWPRVPQARAALGGWFAWLVERGELDASPLPPASRRPRRRPRDRVLSLDELRDIWRACGDDNYGRIVRLLVITAARREEIGGLAWAEVGADRLTLPATRVKGRRGHSIPLLPVYASLLPPRRDGFPFVFGRCRNSGFSGWSKGKAALGGKPTAGGWRLHDLRRSAATHWAEQGLADFDLIELALGHVRPGVGGVYNRSQRWPERCTLMNAWAGLFIFP